MAATQASTKRGLEFVESNVNGGNFAFNFGVFQSTPLSPFFHDQQSCEISPASLCRKRARLYHPGQLPVDCNSTGTSTPFTSPSESVGSTPTLRVQRDPNINEFSEGQLFSLPPNVPPWSSPIEGMPRSDPAVGKLSLSSSAESRESSNVQMTQSVPSRRSKDLKFNNAIYYSRRKPVPGENAPRLASTWKATTSSRGSENPLSARGQAKANAARTSAAGISTVDVATDGGAFTPTSIHLWGDLSVWSGDAAIDGQDSIYLDQPIFQSGPETVNDRSLLMSCDALNDSDVWSDSSPASAPAFLNSLHNIDSFSPTYSGEHESVLPNIGSSIGPYQAGSVSNTAAWSVTPSPQGFDVLESHTPSTRNGSFDGGVFRVAPYLDSNLGSSSRPMGSGEEKHRSVEGSTRIFEPIAPTNNYRDFDEDFHMNLAITLPGPSDASVDTFMDSDVLSDNFNSAEYLGFGDSGGASPATLQRDHDCSSGMFQLQNTNALSHDTIEQLPGGFIDFGFTLPEDKTNSNYANPTGSLLRVHSQKGRMQTKRQHKHAVGVRLPYRNSNSRLLALGSSEFGTKSLSMHRCLESRTDIPPNFGTSVSTDFGDGISGSGESEDNNSSDPITRNRVWGDADRKNGRPQESLAPKISKFGSLSSKGSNPGDTSQSSILVLSEATNDTQEEVQNLLAKANRHPRSVETRSLNSSPPRKIPPNWEHTFVLQNTFAEATGMITTEFFAEKKIGGRRRPLEQDSRERAKEMRKLGACLRCSILKIPCSPAEICKPCMKAATSPLNGKVCSRAHLKDYATIFQPERVVRPFQKTAVNQLIAENISGFSDNRFEIYVSSGPTYPPIQLIVRDFQVRDPSFLTFRKLITNNITKVTALVNVYAPPLGIIDSSQDLKHKLRGHIREVIESERNYGEVFHGEMSQLTWDVYEAVRLFQGANPRNPFLRSMLSLHAMQYFMTTSITILRDSSEEVLNSLPRPRQLEYIHNPILRLINIQIKHVMCTLVQEAYLDLLEELEKALRQKVPAQWAPTFCCVMILCMCAEMVQTSTDFRVVKSLHVTVKPSTMLDKSNNPTSREESIEACRKLDDLPIASSMNLFHLAYKTAKPKDGSKRERGFNPIRQGLDAVKKAELGQDVQEFVERMRNIVSDHRNELEHQAANPSFNSNSDTLKDHANFRKQNQGRLVATFLQSML